MYEFTESDRKLAVDFLIRAIMKCNPRVLRDLASGKSTLAQEARWARLNCNPIDELEDAENGTQRS
jgi:hypothetical protein